MMVWTDVIRVSDADQALRVFSAEVDAVVQQPSNQMDNVGFVPPD
jgi:hypothetical protein